MTATRPRRSVLYLPGSKPRVLDKARDLPADALIFDLEDAVGPDEKAGAREAVRAALAAGGYGERERVVRINALSTPWGTEDLLAAVAAGADAVLVPKIASAADLGAVATSLEAMDATGTIAIWTMIETPLAILNIAEIARQGAGTPAGAAAFVLGTNDLSKETGASPDRERMALLPWLQTALAGARAYGIAIVDGVYNNIADAAGFEAECRQGRLLGMDGKTLIHPSQIAPANEIFAPDSEEIEQARAILAAFAAPENQGKGVISLKGRMVERLHAEMAARVVAVADAIGVDAETGGPAAPGETSEEGA